VGFTRYILFESPNIISSKRIIAISNFLGEEIQRIFPFTNTQKIRVIYNPIDKEAFSLVNPEKAKELLGLDCFEHVVLNIQAPGRQNDYEYIQIAKTVLAKQKNVAIVIIMRNTNSYSYIKKLLGRFGNVIILYGISDYTLNLLYNASDIFFTISNWESFGYPIAESMFAGKPVIGYNVTAIGELIVNGFNGFKVPLGHWDAMANAICSLLNDEETRKQFGKNAREFAVKNFSLDTITQRLLAIYKEVVESK
jgi:glycosyltransferase involved in cell wall biosynthesis